MTRPYAVLFLCTGNSARSILAESLLNRMAVDRFHALSAGSQPAGQVNPFALALLKREGHDTTGLRSKSWDEIAAAGAPLDFVFTVCDSAAAETCPVWPGQPVSAHWGLPDPAAVTGSDAQKAAAFADTYRQLRQRLDAFTNLPMASLDRLSLKSRLDAIGEG
ncbi:arsenate reductase ArsC [Hyphobacterium marinum]|uniref:Arsenate reductase ArsC n=1 Tax=Hyphobacterium marinum TaxID=3116574 RepID=A0ABU7LX43_9PROT|nr:arsenate reductase ArsC [Hyphobacterium sp. Y6023]MEE2565560.1 arsenate reductase ArsC [Hyphobacterium sp. Y6023]